MRTFTLGFVDNSLLRSSLCWPPSVMHLLIESSRHPSAQFPALSKSNKPALNEHVTWSSQRCHLGSEFPSPRPPSPPHLFVWHIPQFPCCRIVFCDTLAFPPLPEGNARMDGCCCRATLPRMRLSFRTVLLTLAASFICCLISCRLILDFDSYFERSPSATQLTLNIFAETYWRTLSIRSCILSQSGRCTMLMVPLQVNSILYNLNRWLTLWFFFRVFF